jgi:hypothetical protein
MSKVPNPKLQLGSSGVLTVSFFALAITVKEVNSVTHSHNGRRKELMGVQIRSAENRKE